jgi:hypothetical protein
MPSIPVRRKTTPELALDGFRQMLAGAPEWTPIPVRVTAARKVVCRSKLIPSSNPDHRGCLSSAAAGWQDHDVYPRPAPEQNPATLSSDAPQDKLLEPPLKITLSFAVLQRCSTRARALKF